MYLQFILYGLFVIQFRYLKINRMKLNYNNWKQYLRKCHHQIQTCTLFIRRKLRTLLLYDNWQHLIFLKVLQKTDVNMKSAIRHLFTVFRSASWGFKATEATGCLYVTMKAKPREIVAVELDNKVAYRPNSQWIGILLYQRKLIFVGDA